VTTELHCGILLFERGELDNKKYIAHYWSLLVMQVRNEENKEAPNPGSGQNTVTNVFVRNKPTNLKN
jgi:hypothetical protein